MIKLKMNIFFTKYDKKIMSDWKIAEYWSKEKWDHAYELFLSSSPLDVLNEELEFRATKDPWSDLGFSIDTEIPIYGFYRDIDKRAILLVISRSHKMKYQDWDILSKCVNTTQHLNILDKLTINSIIYQIYG